MMEHLCPPGQHVYYAGVELCAVCGLIEQSVPPAVSAEDAAHAAREEAENALRAIHGGSFTLEECQAQAEICREQATAMLRYPGALPSRIHRGFSAARNIFQLWEEFWGQEEPAKMEHRLRTYLQPAKTLAREWQEELLLARGRRAAGAE